MRASHLFSVLAASAALAGGTALLSTAQAQAQAQTDIQEISYERSDLSLQQVLTKLMAAGYDKVDKIERERNAYEVRVIDKSGSRVRLTVDPQTGDIIKSVRKGARQEQRAADGGPA